MKIAFFATEIGDAPWGWGGSEELWCRAARFALDRGHQVAIVKFRWPEIPPKIRELQGRGAWLLQIAHPRDWQPGHRLRLRLIWKLERFRIWGAIDSWRPDVVCVSQGGTYDMVLGAFSFTRFLDEHDIPYLVICQHNFEEPFLATEAARQAAIAYFSRARRVAFVAERNLRVAERQLAASVPNACVVRNPVNLADHRPEPYPDSDIAKLANVARLDAHFKGQDLLLQALSGEPWKGRRWLLRFYGAGPDRPYLGRLADYYQISERVEFCGHVHDVRSIWADNHLLVMPSRSEGTPLALVEAMICARPAVVTDVGGHMEWVEEPATGFVAEAASARSLGGALERAWGARPDWEAMGRRAHEVAVSKADRHPGESLLSLLLQIESDAADDRPPCSKASQPHPCENLR